MTILWIIYGFASGNAYSIKRIVIAAVGGYSFSTLWYVTALIIFTIVFYIIFRNGINKISLLKMSVALLIYIIICLQLPTVAWTASTSLFYLGILFAIYRDKVILSIEKNYILWIFASALVFIAGFGSKALLDSVGMTGKTIQVIPRNAIAVGFVSTTLLILYKIKPGNGIIRFFSKISYEIYMLQFLMIEIFYRYLELKWYVLPVLFFTVFCAILLKPLNDKVLRVVRNKADIVKLRN